MDCSEERCGAFIVSGCNGAELLEFFEEIFNQMARFIELFIVIPLIFTIRFRGDNGLYIRGLQRNNNTIIGIIGLIRQKSLRLYLRQKNIRSIQITGLTLG